MSKPKIQVLDAAAVPSDALAVFFRRVWDRDATGELVTAARHRAAVENLARPGAEVPTVIVLLDDRVVGYCSSLPVQLWDGRASVPGYWAKGLMVLPEYRNGPIGFLVVKALVERLERSVVLTVAPASVRLFEALGYANLGLMPNYLCVVRPGRLASRLPLASLAGRVPRVVVRGVRFAQRIGALPLVAAAVGTGVRAATAAICVIARIGLTVESSERLPSSAELDGLWLLVRRSGLRGVVRDSRYLGQRYSGDRYHYVVVRHGRRLRALAVVQGPRLQEDERVRGVSLGALSDLVVGLGDSRAAIAAIHGAAGLARRLGGDALLASTPSRWMHRLLLRLAWLPVPGNLRFLMRDTDSPQRWPDRVRDWWLMRGDGESDGAL